MLYCVYLKYVIKIVIITNIEYLLNTMKYFQVFLCVYFEFLSYPPKYPEAIEELVGEQRDGVSCPGFSIFQSVKDTGKV